MSNNFFSFINTKMTIRHRHQIFFCIALTFLFLDSHIRSDISICLFLFYFFGETTKFHN